MTNAQSMNVKHCIRTITGRYVHILQPDPEMFEIEDIAHALAHQCRFAGHVRKFYSVAQHSVLMVRLVKDELKLQALLHDASEAYLLDMPKPYKEQLRDYQGYESLFMKRIAERFQFTFPLSPEVKACDDFMLRWEWEKLVLGGGLGVECWSSKQAKRHFLETYESIQKNQNSR